LSQEIKKDMVRKDGNISGPRECKPLQRLHLDVANGMLQDEKTLRLFS
jgi:hypothetical protein